MIPATTIAILASGLVARVVLHVSARRRRSPAHVMTADQAEAAGYTVDRQAYPWMAYKGARFKPDECLVIATPGWPNEKES